MYLDGVTITVGFMNVVSAVILLELISAFRDIARVTA